MPKPPASYGAQVKLKALEPDPPPTPPAPLAGAAPDPDLAAPAGRRRPMETKSDPTIIYLHPDGKYELKRYALARGPKVKVHDLLIEALEEWAERHGIGAPFRVPSERPRRP
jgi:hypothetical protein